MSLCKHCGKEKTRDANGDPRCNHCRNATQSKRYIKKPRVYLIATHCPFGHIRVKGKHHWSCPTCAYEKKIASKGASVNYFMELGL